MIFGAIGAVLAFAGATALYLASPNQLLLTHALGRAAGWAGAAMLGAGLIALLQWAGPATAVFIVLTVAMLVWTVVPPLAAWRRGDRKAAR